MNRSLRMAAFLVLVLTAITFFAQKAGAIDKIVSSGSINLEHKNEIKTRGIVFLQNGGLWLTDKDLKGKKKLTDEITIKEFYFSPDHKEIFYLKADGIWKMGMEGGKKIALAAEPTIVTFSISPNGKYLVYEKQDARIPAPLSGKDYKADVTRIWIMKSDGTGKFKVTTPFKKTDSVHSAKWLPDSRGILIYPTDLYEGWAETFADKDYYVAGVDGKDPQKYNVLGELQKRPESEISFELYFSPTGRDVAFIPRGKSGELWLSDVNGNDRKIIYRAEGTYLDIWQWSEDGEEMIVERIVPYKGRFYMGLNKCGEILFEISPGWFPSEIVLSPDKRYLAIAQTPSAYGIKNSYHDRDRIVIYDTLTRKIKELIPELPEISPEKSYLHVGNLVFSRDNKLFYNVTCGYYLKGISETLPQLWVIDTDKWKSYYLENNVSKTKRAEF